MSNGYVAVVVVEDGEGIIVPVYPVSSLSSLKAQVCGDSPESIRPAGISIQTRSIGGRNCLRRRICGCFVVLCLFCVIFPFCVSAGGMVTSISAITMIPTLSADTVSRVSVSGASAERNVGMGRVARSAASYVRGVEVGADGCVYLSLLGVFVSWVMLAVR